MQLPQPYLFTSPRMIAVVDRDQMAPREGPIADVIYGYHTLWAAEVPFIPAYIRKDDQDFEEDSSRHIARVLERQVRFLYDLAQSRDHLSTFELRLVSWPQSGGFARVGIVFFGKVFHQDEQTSRELARGLWDKFSAIFPHEAPLSYPLVPVQETLQPAYPQKRSFAEWHQPLPFESLANAKSIVELRKYEDWPTIRGIGGVLHASDYIPHPFVPALDHTAMARLFETMARQREVCIAAITLRPQRLTDQEVVILHELAGWYQRASRGETIIDNPLVEVLRELKSDILESYTRSRAELGLKVFENLVREQRSLFLVRLQVIGTPCAQDDLIEALGSEVMANAGSAYPSRWTRVEPAEHELRWTRFNLQWLEFVRWGISSHIQQFLPIVRLRQLAAVQEAAGAFRLPVASSSGALAGLEIRDEPFTTPDPQTARDQGLKVGMILDRGVPTGIPFTLSPSMFSGLSQLFGEADASRERVLHEVLQSLLAHAIPWIMIRTTPTADLEQLGRLNVRYISIDKLFSAATFPLHPFLPPPGVMLSGFLDTLLRVLIVAYKLDNASSIVLRRALAETYDEAGWAETTRGRLVDLSALATRIETLARQKDVPTQIGTLLRTRCVLPLRDLDMAVVPLFDPTNVPLDPWSEPTIFEIGWLGSDVNATVVQGCLWAWLALARTVHPAPHSLAPRGIIGLEDAHQLFTMTMQQEGKEPGFTTSSMLSLALTLARSGIGTLFIDRRPDLLDTEVIGKAGVTLLTHNANSEVQKQAAALIGASPRQQTRIRHLKDGETVIAVRGSIPALVLL